MSKLIDNGRRGKTGKKLMNKIKAKSKLSIASSLFTIFAFDELKEKLDDIDKLNFLFTNSINEGEEINPLNFISGTINELKYKNKLNQGNIARRCSDWIKKNVTFKAVSDPELIDNNLYNIKNEDNYAIQGSSVFSASGLGFTKNKKWDLNTEIENKLLAEEYLNWFNEIWNNQAILTDVTDLVIERLENLYQDNTPDFLYYFTLYNIFKDYLAELDGDEIVDSNTGIKESEIWNKLYTFQKDGVKGAIEKLEKHNGCIIADSVGLGKTFEALAVIKYYELRNDRVMVLCPKKLRENWTIYTQNDKRNILGEDRFNYDVLNHTDLSRYFGKSGDINLKTLNWSNYDLIVIDESHNFRNNPSVKDHETRYSRLMNEVIKSGVKTKVLMLSATPVNNRMNDIKNQIAFITEGNDYAFKDEGIKSISQTLRRAQYIYNKWQDKPEEERTQKEFLDMINFSYFKLLDAVTIARSRRHIEKYYDINEVGEFPIRLKPQNIYSEIDKKSQFPSLEKVNNEINHLNLSIYSPIKYVRMDKKQEYSDKYDQKLNNGQSVFRQVDREENLIHLMRTNILKRMESSIHAFGITIANILKKIDDFLDKIENKHEFSNEELSINEIDVEDLDEEIEDMVIGNKVKVLLQDMDHHRWEQDLKEDKKRLEKLLKETAQIRPSRDAKLDNLKYKIKEKLNNPINENNKKIVIFSAFADTVKYLYDNIADWILEEFSLHSAMVTGSGSNKTTYKEINKDINSILDSFAPKAKERESIQPGLKDEIDILIATDCISEGQNLQDCDYLINYDIHWNPVRIIQRFGRIDRIGSENKYIQLVNFWPNLELDEYINLEARVSGRMVLLDVSATGEENIINYSDKKKMNDLEYRRKQLKRLQEEVIDLEDVSGGISITDITLNDFKMDLLDYLKKNKDKIENSPTGIYSLVNNRDSDSDFNSGVIFCFKQINEDLEIDEANTLHPYYLIMIDEDKNIIYNHLHVKMVLDYYRKLAKGKDFINKNLIDKFNQQTNYGENMSEYQELLKTSIQEVIGKNEEKGVESLFSRGGTTLKKDLFKGIEDFELISYLIIK